MGDARDGRLGFSRMARTTRVGNGKYLAGFWIIEAADLDVALKLATEGSTALQPEGRGAALCCESQRPCPRSAQVSGDGFDGSDRSRPAYQKVLKAIRGAGVGLGQRCS